MGCAPSARSASPLARSEDVKQHSGQSSRCRTPFVRPIPPFVAFRLPALRRAGTIASHVKRRSFLATALCADRRHPVPAHHYCRPLRPIRSWAICRARQRSSHGEQHYERGLHVSPRSLRRLSTFVCAVPLTIILYTLLKPVSRNAALLMLGFSVVQDAIGGLNVLNNTGRCNSSGARRT